MSRAEAWVEAYDCVSEFYQGRYARRSGRPYICHIDEGLRILHGAPGVVRAAWCLHPLVQRDEDLRETLRGGRLRGLDPEAVALAMEYRARANAHLSHHGPKVPDVGQLPAVRALLIADKVQNRKDFETYLRGRIPNSDRLDAYFREWMRALDLDYQAEVCKITAGQWRWPLPIPPALPDAPGRFGAVRRYNVHAGVDLYAPSGTPVLAVESGRVSQVEVFTGPNVVDPRPSPWWHETWAVYVEGPSGVVVYGEIDPSVDVGQPVAAGQEVGSVLRVLRRDKGRPTSMLHLELYDSRPDRMVWELDQPRPDRMLDPTALLLGAARGAPMTAKWNEGGGR